MTYGGFRAAPADFAAAAPRIAEAADAVFAAFARLRRALEEHGPFWGDDADFELCYRVDSAAAADLARDCGRRLAALAERLRGGAAIYEVVDARAAELFGTVAARLDEEGAVRAAIGSGAAR